MKRLILGILVILLIGSLAIVGCQGEESTPAPTSTPTSAPAPTPAEQIVLSYNKMGPTVQRASQEPAEYFAAEVEKRTEGRVKIELYPNSALANPQQTYEAVLNGVSDIGESQAAYTAGRFPATQISEIPLGYNNSWVGSHAMTDWMEHFKPTEWDKTVTMYMFVTTPYLIGTVNKPVRKVEDLKGMIIRSSGIASDEYVKALGATPRAFPVTEVYEALSKAMIDGMLMPFEAYPAFKFHEVVKYATDTSFSSYAGASYVVMNKASYSKLSPQDQQILLEVGYDTMDLRGRIFVEESTNAQELFLSQPGRELITLAPEEVAKVQAAANKVIDGWIKEKTADGFPAQEYVDYMRERVEYWSTQQ